MAFPGVARWRVYHRAIFLSPFQGVIGGGEAHDHARRREGRTQPVTTNHRQTNGRHHGNDGRNCSGWPNANHHRNGWVTRWK
jgi:hypothetical protein